MRNITAKELDILIKFYISNGLLKIAEKYKREYEDLQAYLNRD
jgi:hypothetical protein